MNLKPCSLYLETLLPILKNEHFSLFSSLLKIVASYCKVCPLAPLPHASHPKVILMNTPQGESVAPQVYATDNEFFAVFFAGGKYSGAEKEERFLSACSESIWNASRMRTLYFSIFQKYFSILNIFVRKNCKIKVFFFPCAF